jgi:hypothetical protein
VKVGRGMHRQPCTDVKAICSEMQALHMGHGVTGGVAVTAAAMTLHCWAVSGTVVCSPCVVLVGVVCASDGVGQPR